MVRAIKTNVDRQNSEVAPSLRAAIEDSQKRLNGIIDNRLAKEMLSDEERHLRETLGESLRNGEWRKSFRGRDMLRRFVGQHVSGINYERFRNLVLAKMRDAEYQPTGMKNVLDKILMDEQSHR